MTSFDSLDTISILSSYLRGFVGQGNDASFNHLVVQVVSLAGSLAHAGEHRVAAMSLSHVVVLTKVIEKQHDRKVKYDRKSKSDRKAAYMVLFKPK